MRLRVYILFLLISQISLAQNCDVDQIKHLLQNQQYSLVYSMAETVKDCRFERVRCRMDSVLSSY